MIQCGRTVSQDVSFRGGPASRLPSQMGSTYNRVLGLYRDDRQYHKNWYGNKSNDQSVFHSPIHVVENDQTQYLSS